MFTVRGSGGDARRDADPDVVEPTWFLHHGVDLPCIRRLRVENIFRIVEDYHHFL